jgi:predicted nucleotidyltransferase
MTGDRSGVEAVLNAIRRNRLTLDECTARVRLERVRLEAAIVEAHVAGATQTAIAEAAGVSQPYVSQVLAKRGGRFIPRSPLGERLAVHRAEVGEILDRFGASNPAVFGSVARGDDGAGSDVDLLVELSDDVGLFALGRLESELAELLGAKVDVVPSRLVRADLQPAIDADLVPL